MSRQPSVNEAPRLSDLRGSGAHVHAQHDPQSQSFFQRYGSNLPTSLTYMRHTLQRLITFETGCGNGYGHSVANTRVKCSCAAKAFTAFRRPHSRRRDTRVSPYDVYSKRLVVPLLAIENRAHFVVSPRPPFHGTQVASVYPREQGTLLYKASLFRHARCFQSYEPYQREKKSPR